MTQQTASAMTQGSRFQNNYGGAAPQAEQCGWQHYYDYAQQLHSAGDEAQAGRYYEYARQLYDAALAAEQQQGVSSAQGDVQGTSAPQADAAAAPASWEAYYNYAQQLHAAGYTQEAEAHYRYAQQLFSETAKQVEYQSAAAETSYSVPSQYETSATVSYMPQQTTASITPQYEASTAASYMPQRSYTPQSATISGSLGSATEWNSEYVEEDEPLQRRPKRPLKQRIKFWAPVILASLLVVGLGGLVALFSYYKTQLHQTEAERTQEHSLMGMVINAAIQPMVDALKPAFDKTIRLSDAAQPLLYELNLRTTPPPDYNLNATNIDAAAETVTVPPTLSEAVLPPSPQAAPIAAAESGQPETATAADELAAAPEEPEAPATTASDNRSEKEKKTTAPKKTHRPRRSVAHRNRQPKKKAPSANRNPQPSRPDLAKNKRGSAKNRNGAKLSDDPLAEFLL